MYKISSIQKSNAKKLNVDIKPSTNKNKKIDVFKDDKKVGSIGAIKYKDYSIYFKKRGGKEIADQRKNYIAIDH